MNLEDGIKAIVKLVADMEEKAAIVRFAVVDGEFIATVEVRDGEGEEAEACGSVALLDDAEDQIRAMARKLTQEERSVVGDLLLLARNVTERGEVRSNEGHGKTPDGAVANLHESLRRFYKETFDEIETAQTRAMN